MPEKAGAPTASLKGSDSAAASSENAKEKPRQAAVKVSSAKAGTPSAKSGLTKTSDKAGATAVPATSPEKSATAGKAKQKQEQTVAGTPPATGGTPLSVKGGQRETPRKTGVTSASGAGISSFAKERSAFSSESPTVAGTANGNTTTSAAPQEVRFTVLLGGRESGAREGATANASSLAKRKYSEPAAIKTPGVTADTPPGKGGPEKTSEKAEATPASGTGPSSAAEKRRVLFSESLAAADPASGEALDSASTESVKFTVVLRDVEGGRRGGGETETASPAKKKQADQAAAKPAFPPVMAPKIAGSTSASGTGSSLASGSQGPTGASAAGSGSTSNSTPTVGVTFTVLLGEPERGRKGGMKTKAGSSPANEQGGAGNC